ncbi:hypothetical protein Ptr902_12694 [Pyrenophora tritici-repentis]|nr:hypothetical protein Ptr902_12694 [Pyrenophora tritici-repentis]
MVHALIAYNATVQYAAANKPITQALSATYFKAKGPRLKENQKLSTTTTSGIVL